MEKVGAPSTETAEARLPVFDALLFRHSINANKTPSLAQHLVDSTVEGPRQSLIYWFASTAEATKLFRCWQARYHAVSFLCAWWPFSSGGLDTDFLQFSSRSSSFGIIYQYCLFINSSGFKLSSLSRLEYVVSP